MPSADSGQASWQTKLESRVGVSNMVSTIPPEKAMDLEFGPLSYGVPQGRKKGVKKILHEVYGRFRPGTLSAIMGPSGAGKTCLLNVLAGYKSTNVKGEILINGNPRDLRKFRKQSSYIMQDDCVFGNLTVSETLLFAAELKCGPARSSQKDRKLLVADIMETLGMAACATTMARSLSGGERKRLCIAIELINNPPIMFFDEPTSGLDSQTCFQFISLLSALAAAGRTIICTIHQPSMRLLEMFQHLMVMANGRCIYRGNVPNMVPYLATKGLICPPYHNPADFVMEIVLGEASKPVVKSLVEGANNGKCEDWDNSDIDISPPSYSSRQDSSDESSTDIDVIGKSEGAPALIIDDAQCWSKEEAFIKEPLTDSTSDHYDMFSASHPVQLWVLMKRAFLLIIRDRILLYTRFAAHLFVGLIMGMMFYGVGNDADKAWSNASSLFFNLIVLIFAAMMATILTFPLELPVVIREHMNSWYSLKMYFLAQTLLDLPFQIFFAGIYHCMTYFMTGQPLELERFFLTLAVAVLVSITAQNVGVMVGAFVEIQAGVFLGPLFTIPVMLFCGFFISVEKMPYFLQWMPWISYLRYAYEAVFAATYGMEREDLDCFNPYCHFKDPETFLDFLDLPNVQYWPNLFVLAGLATLFRALAYFFVRRKVRSGR